jgi:hypothetical protein
VEYEMTFKTASNTALGITAFVLAAVDVTPKVPVGTIAKAFDDTLGEAEFIYLPGAANVAAGDTVVYDLLPAGQTVTRVTSGANANSGQPVAVALVAIGAGSYGWYQISGVAIVNVTAASAAGKAMLTATAGSLNSAAVAGAQIIGARLSSAIGTPAAGQAYATLNRPSVQTQIT